MSDRRKIEEAFHRVREELGIRTKFPAEVTAAAAAAAAPGETLWRAESGREDLTGLPFVTIDPPGSRDLDQALFIEQLPEGLRLQYAIADVGNFVARGSAIEAEAWLRGMTAYSPDRRDPLYPAVLSQGAASLLPDVARPAIVFDLQLDLRGDLFSTRVFPAIVRSRAQLTYHQALEHIEGGGQLFADEDFATSLSLLQTFGELRLERERARGGVSLPILDQHVERSAAHRLGYELAYETPNVAESWNAQLSLLAGHAAALRMAEGNVGLLRTMPPPGNEEIETLRVAALALGFAWPTQTSYAAFLHSVDRAHPNLQVLVWQARRLMRGAGYVVFTEEVTELPMHSAIALPYAHCTAPLRRLADRYVLDLLVDRERAVPPTDAALATLSELPAVMAETGRRSSALERRVLDVAEAWELRDRVGSTFRARVLNARKDDFDAQLEELPVRARVPLDGAPQPRLGEEVAVKLVEVALEEGRSDFALSGIAG